MRRVFLCKIVAVRAQPPGLDHGCVALSLASLARGKSVIWGAEHISACHQAFWANFQHDQTIPIGNFVKHWLGFDTVSIETGLTDPELVKVFLAEGFSQAFRSAGYLMHLRFGSEAGLTGGLSDPPDQTPPIRQHLIAIQEQNSRWTIFDSAQLQDFPNDEILQRFFEQTGVTVWDHLEDLQNGLFAALLESGADTPPLLSVAIFRCISSDSR